MAAPLTSRVLQGADSESNATTFTCPPCPQCNNVTATADELITLQILVVDSQGIVDMGEFWMLYRALLLFVPYSLIHHSYLYYTHIHTVAWNARDNETVNRNVKIKIKKAPTMPETFQEIENDARSA